MKFNYYDTLVNLVLGYLLLFLVIAVEGIEYIENFSIAYIAAGFVLGYFINALSSIVEPIYFWTFGGKPSVKIFRVNKNKNYTVMSNYHLKDANMSFKAKGLLSMMLSLLLLAHLQISIFKCVREPEFLFSH